MSKILRKLRFKFMLMTTGIVAIIIAVIAIAYCAGIYTSASTEIDIAFERALGSSASINPFSLDQQDRSLGSTPQEQLPLNTPLQGQNPSNQNPESLQDSNNLSVDQRIDLFRGKTALVYSVVIDDEGTVLYNNSPAIGLDDTVLESAISSALSSPDFSNEEGGVSSGRIDKEGLFYRMEVRNGNIYLGLTDATTFDERIQEAIIGSVVLAGVALVLTIAISFFLARLFLRPVEEAWNKQRRFIADASHELKTPLTVIMANTEIVRTEPTCTVASQMKWLDGVMDESDRMHGLIADLLLLARMDDEKISAGHPSEEPINLSEAVENTFVSFEAIAFERKLTIEESLEPNIFVKGMRSRLSRLPDILVDNACKYAEPGGIVRVSLAGEETKVLLRVFNTGLEISEADMKHLFDRFYRADESRCDDIPGYGLGLSIAQSIVDECNGTIEVENIEGEGVVFTVTFPRVT